MRWFLKVIRYIGGSIAYSQSVWVSKKCTVVFAHAGRATLWTLPRFLVFVFSVLSSVFRPWWWINMNIQKSKNSIIYNPKPNSNLTCFWPFLSNEFSATVNDMRSLSCLFSWISHYRIVIKTGEQFLQLFLFAEIQLAIPGRYRSFF